MNNRTVFETFSRHSGTFHEKHGKEISDCDPHSAIRINAVT